MLTHIGIEVYIFIKYTVDELEKETVNVNKI